MQSSGAHGKQITWAYVSMRLKQSFAHLIFWFIVSLNHVQISKLAVIDDWAIETMDVRISNQPPFVNLLKQFSRLSKNTRTLMEWSTRGTNACTVTWLTCERMNDGSLMNWREASANKMWMRRYWRGWNESECRRVLAYSFYMIEMKENMHPKKGDCFLPVRFLPMFSG